MQELVTRLSSEQQEKYKLQAEQDYKVKTTEDVALEKV